MRHGIIRVVSVGFTALIVLGGGGSYCAGASDGSSEQKLWLIRELSAGWSTVSRWRVVYEVRSMGAPKHMAMAQAKPGQLHAYPWQVDPYRSCKIPMVTT